MATPVAPTPPGILATTVLLEVSITATGLEPLGAKRGHIRVFPVGSDSYPNLRDSNARHGHLGGYRVARRVDYRDVAAGVGHISMLSVRGDGHSHRGSP